jgi:hypothetical protein
VASLYPELSVNQIEKKAENLFLPTRTIPVFHIMKFVDETGRTLDTIHVRPPRKDSQGRPVPAQFDTALINIDGVSNEGVKGNIVLSYK